MQLIKQTGKRIESTNIRLRHDGYSGELRGKKLQRALPLLEMELREHPGQLYYLIEYGRTLLQLGQQRGHEVMGSALAQMWKRRHQAQAPMPLVAALLEYAMTTPADLLHGPVFPDDAAALARRWFPDSPPLLWVIAQTHFTAGRFADGAAALEHLRWLAGSGKYDSSVAFDPRILGADAAINLGGCYVRMGQLDRAEKLFRSILPNAAAESNLKLIWQLREAK